MDEHTLISYSERFNKPIDNLLARLIKQHGYSEKKAKEVVKKIFNISLNYA
jgi:hypothetical protein